MIEKKGRTDGYDQNQYKSLPTFQMSQPRSKSIPLLDQSSFPVGLLKNNLHVENLIVIELDVQHMWVSKDFK